VFPYNISSLYFEPPPPSPNGSAFSLQGWVNYGVRRNESWSEAGGGSQSLSWSHAMRAHGAYNYSDDPAADVTEVALSGWSAARFSSPEACYVQQTRTAGGAIVNADVTDDCVGSRSRELLCERFGECVTARRGVNLPAPDDAAPHEVSAMRATEEPLVRGLVAMGAADAASRRAYRGARGRPQPFRAHVQALKGDHLSAPLFDPPSRDIAGVDMLKLEDFFSESDMNEDGVVDADEFLVFYERMRDAAIFLDGNVTDTPVEDNHDVTYTRSLQRMLHSAVSLMQRALNI
jgi:hypothetical protein